MTLDQTLIEIEPILRGTDGAFQFTHPSFQEILTAKQFADEINSGELNLNEVLETYFIEPNHSSPRSPFDSRKKIPEEGYKRIFSFLVEFLNPERSRELLQIIAIDDSTFLKYVGKIDSMNIKILAKTVVQEDLAILYGLRNFIVEMYSQNKPDEIKNLLDYPCDGIKVACLKAMEKLRVYDSRIPSLIRYSSGFSVQDAGLRLLGALRKDIDTILEYARRGYASAVDALGVSGHYDESITKIITLQHVPACVLTGLDALMKLNHYDRCIFDVLGYGEQPLSEIDEADDDHDWRADYQLVTNKALRALSFFVPTHYKEIADEFQKDSTYLPKLVPHLKEAAPNILLEELERRGLEKFDRDGVRMLKEKCH